MKALTQAGAAAIVLGGPALAALPVAAQTELLSTRSDTHSYDLVIAGGRVLDPASGRDEVLNIGILNGRIVTLSGETLEGAREVDASGRLVEDSLRDLVDHFEAAHLETRAVQLRSGDQVGASQFCGEPAGQAIPVLRERKLSGVAGALGELRRKLALQRGEVDRTQPLLGLLQRGNGLVESRRVAQSFGVLDCGIARLDLVKGRRGQNPHEIRSTVH